jgi:hypothetical protein
MATKKRAREAPHVVRSPLTPALIATLPPGLEELYTPQPFETNGPVTLLQSGALLAFVTIDDRWHVITAKMYIPVRFDFVDADALIKALCAFRTELDDWQLIVVIVPRVGGGNTSMDASTLMHTFNNAGLEGASPWVYKTGSMVHVDCNHLQRFTAREISTNPEIRSLMSMTQLCGGEVYMQHAFQSVLENASAEAATGVLNSNLDTSELWVLYENETKERVCAAAFTSTDPPVLTIDYLCAPVKGKGLLLFNHIKDAAKADGYTELEMQAANWALRNYYVSAFGMLVNDEMADDSDSESENMHLTYTL